MKEDTTTAKALSDLRQHESDTGSPQVQIIRLTARINDLKEHFQTHKKDHSSRRGLLRMVNRRRNLLDYVKRHEEATYKQLLDTLGLRK